MSQFRAANEKCLDNTEFNSLDQLVGCEAEPNATSFEGNENSSPHNGPSTASSFRVEPRLTSYSPLRASNRPSSSKNYKEQKSLESRLHNRRFKANLDNMNKELDRLENGGVRTSRTKNSSIQKATYFLKMIQMEDSV